MGQQRHEEQFEQLLNHVQSDLGDSRNLENHDIDDHEFMLFRTVELVLNRERIARLVECRGRAENILGNTDSRAIAEKIMASNYNDHQTFSRNHGLDGSLRVFATLIQSGLKAKLREQIDFWIKEEHQNILYDHSLPIEEDKAEDLFGRTGGLAFESAQHRFAVAILSRHEHNEYTSRPRLPFLGEQGESIGKGDSGVVYATKVARGCLAHDDDINVRNRIYAEKVFHEHSVFHEERKMLEALRKDSISDHNIVLHVFSLECDTRYSLFYPKANQNLQQFLFEPLSNGNEPRPLPSDITFLRNANNLLKALSSIHGLEVYHMDIHPRNILIFGDGDDAVWKLADFDRALAAGHEVSRAWRELRAEATSSRDSGESTIACGNLPGTYLPPEAFDGSYTDRSDVWSMGCVVLLIYTCMAGGRESVGRLFPQLYRWHDERKTPITFYFRDNDNDSKPNEFVKSWLADLADEWEGKREMIPFNFPRMTKQLWQHVFSKTNPKDRWRAEDFEKHVRKAKQALEKQPSGPLAGSSDSVPQIPSPTEEQTISPQSTSNHASACSDFCNALRHPWAPQEALRDLINRSTVEDDNGVNDECPVCHTTPLHWMITRGWEDRNRESSRQLLRLLLTVRGLDKNKRNRSGKTPWQVCCARDNFEAAKLLYLAGADCPQDREYERTTERGFRRDWTGFVRTSTG